MLIKGQDVSNIVARQHAQRRRPARQAFDYMLSNPPFGVEWKKVEKAVREEHEQQGFNGRFGPGLPRVSDGSLLFLLHLLSKMRPPQEGGSRIGIVLNGSPLFTGGAGSGESRDPPLPAGERPGRGHRRLPTDMFYNTGISTYIWMLSNRKPDDRKGFVQLIDASASGRRCARAWAPSARR
jgi:type I restriction enzyme M protein